MNEKLLWEVLKFLVAKSDKYVETRSYLLNAIEEEQNPPTNNLSKERAEEIKVKDIDDAICSGCNRKNRWCVCETPEDKQAKELLSQSETIKVKKELF